MNLLIFEQREPPTRKPFRLVELYTSVDGPRWRITDKTFAFADEARQWVAAHEAKKVTT